MSSIVKADFADVSSERSVLTCVLQEPELMVEADAKLAEADFLSDHHRELYAILRYLIAQRFASFDYLIVVELAEKRDLLKSVPEGYIRALYSADTDTRNFPVYVKQVSDRSTAYKILLATERIQKDVLANVDRPAEEQVAVAEARILDISMDVRGDNDPVRLGEGLRERVRQLAENPVEVRGLTTGLPMVDRRLNGLLDGTLTVIGGRLKSGKSVMLMNWAAHIAFTLGIPVLMVDTEMSDKEQEMRLLSHLSAVPERIILNGSFAKNPEARERVETALDRIESGVLHHKYYPGYTVEGLKSIVRKYHALHGIGAFFFDYIKTPETMSSNLMKEYQLLGNITQGLKDLAGALKIPVVAGAQMKRGDSGTPKSLYNKDDFADSDRILRYANSGLALAMKSQKEYEEEGKQCGTHRLQILAARGGGETFHGVDLECHFPTLTIRQAGQQANGMHVGFDEE